MKPAALRFKVQRALRWYGVRGILRLTRSRIRDRLAGDETHVWYVLDLSAPRPNSALAEELTLRTPGIDEVDRLAELPTVSPSEARDFIRQGNDLWMVFEGKQLLFSCWIFRERVAVRTARGGQLALPKGTVCLEFSVAAPAARGRGIAPATWSALADRLRREGQELMITKVREDNAPSRRAVEKVGFVGVALMREHWIGPISRATVKALDEQRARFFVENLHSEAH